MKRLITANTTAQPKSIEVQLDRHNVTPREFFWECKQAARRKGIDIEGYTEYDEWIHPSFENDSRNMGKSADTTRPQEIAKIKPLDYHLYVENTYNFIMEFDYADDKRGHGYMYLAEW